MDERDKRYEQRFQSSEIALANARESLNRRLDLLNELREGVATEAELRALEKIVNDLTGRVREREGRGAGLTSGWGILVGAVLLALAIFAALRT
jgi:hypothetical protein